MGNPMLEIEPIGKWPKWLWSRCRRSFRSID